MNYAINLLRQEIRDLENRIDRVIDNKYEVSRRGQAPVGASWNTSEKAELERLDKIQDEYEAAIKECEEALKCVVANA